MDILLIGAGGHAKAIVEALRAHGHRIAGYVDPAPAAWLDAPRTAHDDAPALRDRAEGIAIGIGGVAPSALATRLALLERYRAAGFAAPLVIHPAAHVSASATLGAGTIVLAGAIVQPDAVIGPGVIVNSGAIVEHDSTIGAGAHVAPRALVLGGCDVGRCCMIGAGALLLPGAALDDETMVSALARHKAA